MTVSEKIVENQMLLAVSRVSMALVIPLGGLLWGLTSTVLAQRAESQDSKLDAMKTVMELRLTQSIANSVIVADTSTRLNDTVSKINDRLTVVETRQSVNVANADAYKRMMADRLDRFESVLTDLTKVVTQLTATIQTERDMRRSDLTTTPKTLQR